MAGCDNLNAEVRTRPFITSVALTRLSLLTGPALLTRVQLFLYRQIELQFLKSSSTTSQRRVRGMLPIRILVVDDFEGWRQKIRGILSNWPGLQVVAEAEDGLEAVQKAKELKPDLVLLDIGLPKLDGIRAAPLIFRSSPTSRIVFVSQENQAEIIRVALDTGASAYIQKLNAPTELLMVVAAVFGYQQTVARRRSGHEAAKQPVSL